MKRMFKYRLHTLRIRLLFVDRNLDYEKVDYNRINSSVDHSKEIADLHVQSLDAAPMKMITFS
jgi:hypothetical protein